MQCRTKGCSREVKYKVSVTGSGKTIPNGLCRDCYERKVFTRLAGVADRNFVDDRWCSYCGELKETPICDLCGDNQAVY